MTRTGRTLTEYMNMGAAGKAALISFIKYLPPDSALNRDMNPKDEVGLWYETLKTNAILADIFDLLARAHSGRRKPEPYPRPTAKKKIGKGAIPVSEFWDWWNNKE